MTRMTLVGVDPGVVDTGVVAIRLDTHAREWRIKSKTWTGVSFRDPKTRALTSLSVEFRKGLEKFVKHEEDLAPTFAGVEGYQQRGNNVRQDQDMLYMVREIAKLLPGSQVVPNTGIKNVVTRDMLKLFQVHRFPGSDNHADRVSAARVALKIGISIPVLNEILYTFVIDNVEGEPWQLVST